MSTPRCDSVHLLDTDPNALTSTTHYSSICDAVTRGPVQRPTQIAALHAFGQDVKQDTHLKNLTRIAEPAVPCRLQVDGGEYLPASSTVETQSFTLHVTYNHLMFSPQLRLECRLEYPTSHVVAVEFPFSSADDTSLEDYNKTTDTRGPVITFTSRGATSSGFGGIRLSSFHPQRPERQVLLLLRSLLKSTATVKLELDTTSLRPDQIRDLADIDAVLPSGCGPLLPSFDRPEYFALDDGSPLTLAETPLKTPWELMHSDVPFPMAPLAPLETFASTKQAAIHLAYAAHSAASEELTSVRAWADSDHTAALFHLESCEVPVLAVRFARDFRRLGSPHESVKFKLPKELEIKAQFRADDGTEDQELILMLDEIAGLPRCDAAFLVLNSGGLPRLRNSDKQVYSINHPFPEFLSIKFKAEPKSRTLDAYLRTAQKLHEKNHPWIAQLLNQDTSQIQDVDLTRECELEQVREADQWLASWRSWNVEQKQLLETVHRAKGGMVIARGPAGTGKSTLITGIALYFARLGYRCLLALPANSNASHLASELNAACPQGDASFETYERASVDRSVDFHGAFTPRTATPTTRRLFASSLAQTLEEMLQTELQGRSHSPTPDALLGLVLQKLKSRKAGDRDCSIEQAVIDEAEKAQFKMYGKEACEGGIKPEDDVWEILRKNIQAAREGTFSWSDKTLRLVFATAYDICRRHVLAATDLLVATTGNAGSQDVRDWARSEEDYGIPSKGVIVFLDESFKDGELGTWNAIMAPGKKVKGAFMFGDEYQLKPTNTTSRGKLTFGHFSDQLDISLPARLVQHGFPYVYLKQQQRMHPCLSRFPNEEFYCGQLRDGLRVNVSLEAVMPGLADVLHKINYDSYSQAHTGLSKEHYWSKRTEEKARLHYVEVEGQRRTGDDGTSKYVQEHIEVFFKYVFPALQKHWGSKTSENVMIITAYTAAKVRYRAEIERLQSEQKRSADFYPSLDGLTLNEGASNGSSSGSSSSGRATPVCESEVPELPPTHPQHLTIDAAQGQESFMVWLDVSAQHRDDIGFMTDRGRCNVALTRAKGVLWMVGGSMGLKNQRNTIRPLSSLPKLKLRMAAEGKVHRFVL